MRLAEAIFWAGFVAHVAGLWFVVGVWWCVLVVGIECMIAGLLGMKHDP